MGRLSPGHVALPVLSFIIAACGALTGTSIPWPIDPDAAVDPERMVVSPAAAEPGDLVELTFRGGHTRGLLFAIDAAVGGGWERRAMLVSDAIGGEPRWSSADGDGLLVEMLEIDGVGPDRVPIPEGLPPGDYRICTANAVENLCVPIEVVAP